MTARFAGSQRLGDRRRRRLAVESDDSSPVELADLPAPAGMQRTAHGPPLEASAGSGSARRALPLAILIPAEWWKYAVAGLGAALVVCGIGIANGQAPAWSQLTGIDFGQVFAPQGSRAAAWFSALVLTVASQVALVIWWLRSQSEKDFDGRYRLWAWVSATWFLLGCCSATGCHQLLAKLVAPHIPGSLPQKELLSWVLPALSIGGRIVLTLRREMGACRISRWLSYLAALAYLGAASAELEMNLLPSSGMRKLIGGVAGLIGHLFVLFAMWLHARHVLHRSLDPCPAAPRRIHLPRPHFSIGRLLGRRGVRSQASLPAESIDTTAAQATAKAPARSALRIRSIAAAKSKAPSLPPEPAPVATARVEGPASESLPQATHVEELPTAGRSAPADACLSETPESSSEKADRPADEGSRIDREESHDESLELPNLKGLSKKQRRRLIQEQRERERAARR